MSALTNTVSKPDTECDRTPKDKGVIDLSTDEDDYRDGKRSPDMPSGLDEALDNATPDMDPPPGNATPLLSDDDDDFTLDDGEAWEQPAAKPAASGSSYTIIDPDDCENPPIQVPAKPKVDTAKATANANAKAAAKERLERAFGDLTTTDPDTVEESVPKGTSMHRVHNLNVILGRLSPEWWSIILVLMTWYDRQTLREVIERRIASHRFDAPFQRKLAKDAVEPFLDALENLKKSALQKKHIPTSFGFERRPTSKDKNRKVASPLPLGDSDKPYGEVEAWMWEEACNHTWEKNHRGNFDHVYIRAFHNQQQKDFSVLTRGPLGVYDWPWFQVNGNFWKALSALDDVGYIAFLGSNGDLLSDLRLHVEEKERKQRCEQEGKTMAIDNAWTLNFAGTTVAYSPTAFTPTVENVPRHAMTAGVSQKELDDKLKKDIDAREQEAAEWRKNNGFVWLPRKDVVVYMRMGTSFETLRQRYGPETIKRALEEGWIHFDGDTLSLRINSKPVKHGTLVQTVAHGTSVNHAEEQMIVYSPQGAHQVRAHPMGIVNLPGWQEARRAYCEKAIELSADTTAKEEKVISTADDEKNETQPVIEEIVTTFIASSDPKGKLVLHPTGVHVEVVSQRVQPVSQDVIDLFDDDDADLIPPPKRPREESVVAKPNKKAKTVGDEGTDSDSEV
jgi:hypothetical protein